MTGHTERLTYANNERSRFLLREVAICKRVLAEPDTRLPNGQSCHARVDERMQRYESELLDHVCMEVIPGRAAIDNCGDAPRKLERPTGPRDGLST